ncbi:MAG: hypothetical protein LBD90_03745 [Bifidobacteriaceae bacterium]|jgi:hypothetical protein|nr:hypothetical protein [Bifidobacteriaceae bacterium]
MAAATIAVVAETALEASDVAQIAGLYGDAVWRVLVPVSGGGRRLRHVLDHLALGQVGGAWSALKGQDPDAVSLDRADVILRASLDQARAAGVEADGQVLPGEVVAALAGLIDSTKAQAVVFVTLPHLVEDALHEDWSAQARRALGVPVIHFYGGTTKLLS